MKHNRLPLGQRTNTAHKTGLVLLILIGVVLSGAMPAWAAPGDLDDTFGTAGIVTTAIGGTFDAGFSLALQPDGKIVVAGCSYNGSDADFAIARYNGDGSLDPSFGTGGIVTTPIGAYGDYAWSLAIQPDGRIVAAGYSNNGPKGNGDFAVVRYNSDGSLDPSFGTGGIVTTDINGDGDYGHSIALQPDGKILVAGTSNNGSNDDFAVVRYNTDGSLDTSFGTGGIVTTDLGGDNDCNSLALQPDGKIVAAGTLNNGSNDDFAVVRYNGDGSLDTSFGTGGIVTTPVGSGNDSLASVALQSDAKIVAAGYSRNGTTPIIAVIRYNGDGGLDPSFGTGGIVTTTIGHGGGALSLALQSDAKIVAAGYHQSLVCEITVVRYTDDGGLDTSFGDDGIVSTNTGNIEDVGYAAAVQPDGKILVAGYAHDGTTTKFAVVRYHGAVSATLTTSEVTSITTNSAICGGDVTSDGGGRVTAKGVCWSTYPNPNLADSHTVDGAGTGAFTGNLTDLYQKTTYYVRAYATNSAGTAYGPEVSFTTGIVAGYHALTVQKDGSGSGAVVSSPAGIDCGDDCGHAYADGTIVTLTGTPDPGSALEGWTINGEVDGEEGGQGNGPCLITLNRDTIVTATFNPDADRDGISDDMENSGPNNGDGNRDAFVDSVQGNVATFTNPAGDWVTLATTGNMVQVYSRAAPATSDFPSGMSMPGGLVGFTLDGLNPGASARVDLILHNKDESLDRYYKYGPTTDNTADHWYAFDYDNSIGAVISREPDRTVITLHLKDGARGDADLDGANGRIVDPSGPAGSGEGRGGGGSGGGGGGCFLGNTVFMRKK